MEHSFCQAWAPGPLLAVLMERNAELYSGAVDSSAAGAVDKLVPQEVVPPAGLA